MASARRYAGGVYANPKIALDGDGLPLATSAGLGQPAGSGTRKSPRGWSAGRSRSFAGLIRPVR
jgi:hypothetical protein